MAANSYDRRSTWKPQPRPEWVQRINEEGEILNKNSIVPLDEGSLLREAMKNTGLDDFGDDEWHEPFRVLLEAIENEAKLNFMGRIMTRSDFILYLEARLRITDWYKRHPEVESEVVREPVFIIGFGRSGTTILSELMGQDPQFRVVKRWEAMFPCPPPEPETYLMDERTEIADQLITLTERVAPEMKAMHKMGGGLPVESVEFLYLTFLSEVFLFAFQIPTYADYLQKQDLTYTFEWQKRFLKLLQSRYRKAHWLLKGPTHLPYLPTLLKVYPDAKVIFTHRDPIVSSDSVVDVQGTIYWWRTDDPWGGGMIDHWVMAEERAKIWDDVIGMIEDGTIAKGSHANFLYRDFMEDPIETIRGIYDELGLELGEEAERNMREYLRNRPQTKYGRHAYESGPESVIAREREVYRRYQDYFGIPNEI